MEDARPEIDEVELRQRVLYALLGPVAALALELGVTAKDVGELQQMALFHETKRRGLTLAQASDLLDVSMRTASRLSKLLKENFLSPEARHALPRRIEFMLWPAPLSEARIFQVLTDVDDPDEVSNALAVLVEEGRVERQVGRTVTYSIAASRRRLVRDQWLARVDALGNLAGNLANVVFARFFDGDPRAFARTLTLRVRDQDLPKLTELYEEVLWKHLSALDEAARGDASAVSLDLSVFWAPYEALRRSPPATDPPEEHTP